MTTPQVLREVLSPALVRGVGYALLHSLWQGGVLALLLAGVLPLLRRHRAEVRYAVAAGALATLVLAVGLTFGFYFQSQPLPTTQWATANPAPAGAAPVVAEPAAALSEVAALATGPAVSLAWVQANASQLEPYLPLVVIGWLLGLLLMSGRLAGGLLYAGRLRRAGTQALGADWQQRLAVLARRAGVRRPVALLESARVAGPLVLGHLRPAILLPLGAVAGLSPALLEALLAHELAHIVRRDYLLNLGLAVAEVLFFYHPAVWFMASCLRAERENCCDDQAAALCSGDRLRVARALAALAELEAATPTPQLALAAAGVGGRGSLLARVRRLALGRPQAPSLGEGLLATLLGVLGVAGLSTGVALAAPAGHKLAKALATSAKQTAPADTTRKPKVAGAAPAADTVRRQVRVQVDTDIKPQVHTYSFSQESPLRRERASTVVIEKDKKGRVVNLVVDGQPVATDPAGKKTKHKEKVRSVEVVRVPDPVRLERPERPERPEQPEAREFSFNFSTDAFGDQARQSARHGLTDALRNPDLTTEQRQAMEKALESLGNNTFRWDAKQWKDVQWKLQQGQLRLQEGQRRLQKAQRQFQLNITSSEADQAAREADRAAERADREAEQADREGERADLAARRAELRARIAAETAELRALEGSNPQAPRAPRVPRAPLAPLSPAPPLPPMGPMPPAPPAPPAAPNIVKLREALRKDDLIKDEKHFSFELSDQSGRVDGKALTPAQVTKYRQLLKLPTAKIKGSKSTYSISVNED